MDYVAFGETIIVIDKVRDFKNKFNLAKVVKICGNILTLIAFAYIIKKIVGMDIDYSKVFTRGNVHIVCALSFLYSICVLISSIPWKIFIQIITQKRVPLNIVTHVYCKSNMYKYIPGNVFQYIGRNEVAYKYNLKQSDVALATAMDILMTLFSVGLISIILYPQGVLKILSFLHIFKLNYIIVFFTVILLLLVILIKNTNRLVKKLRKFINKRFINKLVVCFMFYFIIGLTYGCIYYLVIRYILINYIDLSLIPIIIGGYLYSWIAGYITPGAPGGIGIREAFIMQILSGVLLSETLIVGIIIYRIISIIGDLVAFIFCKLILNNKSS